MESDGDDDQLDQLDAFVENLVSKKKKVESQAEKAVDTSSIDAEGNFGLGNVLTCSSWKAGHERYPRFSYRPKSSVLPKVSGHPTD